MKLRDLCLICNNLTPLAEVEVITSGKEPYIGILDNVFNDIAERLVKWFAVRDGIIIIKLCEV